MILARTRPILVSICLPLACAQPAPTRAPQAAPSVATKPNPFAAAVDFKPEQTRAPAGFWFRFKSPGTVVPRLIGLAADPSLRGFADLHALSGLLLGGELSALIDLDAPISIVFSRETDTMVGAARPMNEARFKPEELGEKLHALGPGRWEIRPSDGGEKLSCELWHAAAPVGYRVLCGAKGTDLAPFAPFLLGQLEKTTPTTDVKVVATHFPFAESMTRHKPDAPDASALTEAMTHSLANVEATAFDINFLQQDVELTVECHFAEDAVSASVRGWATKPPEALPQQFWQTLDLSPIALANAGGDEATTSAFLTEPALVEFFTAINAALGVSPELQHRMLSAMGGFMPKRLRFTLSMGGTLPPSPLRPTSAAPTPRKPGPSDKGSGSWMLTGYAGSGEHYLKGLAVLEEASTSKSSGAATKGPPAYRLARLRKVASDLPPESVLVRATGADKSTWFSWVLPGTDWVWMLSAPTEAQMLAQVRRFLPVLMEAAPLDESERAAFSRVPPLMAMSFSLASLKEALGATLADLELNTLPFGGSARIFASVTGAAKQVDSKPMVALRLTSRWSPAAVADLVALIKRAQKSAEEAAP